MATEAKIESRPGFTVVELGMSHTDGPVTVTVGWDGEDWEATVVGHRTPLSATGILVGHGATHELALCDLVCSLVATIDAITTPEGGSDHAE